MDVVDAQVHGFYKHDEGQLLAAMDALGIAAVLLDEFWSPAGDGDSSPRGPLANGAMRALSPFAQAAALRLPDRFSFLQRVSRHDPDLAAWFAVLGASPGCRAVRVNLRQRTERQALADGDFDHLLRLAIRHGFPVCLIIHGRDSADQVRSLCARFPELRLILDHCGNPKSPEQWEAILALAECPNVTLKWCHAHQHFPTSAYPFPELQSELFRAVRAFGAERVMWASDITHEASGAAWADLLHYVRDNAALSRQDKKWVLGGTARAVFGWSPRGPEENEP